MKQIVAFIVFILSTVCAYPKTDEPAAKVARSGYRGFVDLNAEARFKKKYSNDRDIVYSISGLSTTHGYQFNDHFFVGGGLGLNFITHNYTWAGFASDFSLYAAGRFDWKVGKVPLFADLRLGTFLRASDFDRLFVGPSVGYHCSWGRKVSLNIGGGLSIHWLDNSYESGWRMMPSVRIGIEFF